jgi:hypothetical protein
MNTTKQFQKVLEIRTEVRDGQPLVVGIYARCDVSADPGLLFACHPPAILQNLKTQQERKEKYIGSRRATSPAMYQPYVPVLDEYDPILLHCLLVLPACESPGPALISSSHYTTEMTKVMKMVALTSYRSICHLYKRASNF